MKRLKRLLLILVVLTLGAWVGLSPRVMPSLYYSKLFRPGDARGSIQQFCSFHDVKNREVFFKANGGEALHGWFFYHPTSSQILLVNPGNAGDIPARLSLVRFLLDAGLSVFIYEYRGYGQSSGSPSLAGICEDGVAAYDYLVRSEGYSADNIILYGESLGAAVATHVSTERRCKALILQSGFASLERIGKEKMPILKIYPSWMFPQPRLDTVETLKRDHPPLLVIHGEQDGTVPLAHSEEIYRQAKEPKWFVRFPNSDHFDLGAQDPVLFRKTMADFLSAVR